MYNDVVRLLPDSLADRARSELLYAWPILGTSACTPSMRSRLRVPGERLNAHAEPGRLQRHLKRQGVRLTRQRRVLLEVMDDAEQHLTPAPSSNARRRSIRASIALPSIARSRCSSAAD